MSRYSNPALSQRELGSAIVRRQTSTKPISTATSPSPRSSTLQLQLQLPLQLNTDAVIEEDNNLHNTQSNNMLSQQQSYMDNTPNSDEEWEKQQQEEEQEEPLSPSSKILTARLLLLKSVCFAQNLPLKEAATVLSEDLKTTTAAPLHSTGRKPVLIHQAATTTTTTHRTHLTTAALKGLDAATMAKQLPLGYKHKHWHQRHRITLSKLLGSLSLTLEQVIILALFVAFLWFQFAVEFGSEFAVLRTTSRTHRFFSTSADQSPTPSTTSPASGPFGSCSSSTKQHANLF